MDRMNRRKFIKVSGSAAVAGVGIEGILAARRAPAYAQGTKLHLLRWNDFVPAADEVLAKQMPEASKALGAEVTLERINANDLQARITAAIGAMAMVLALTFRSPGGALAGRPAVAGAR